MKKSCLFFFDYYVEEKQTALFFMDFISLRKQIVTIFYKKMTNFILNQYI